MAKCRSCPSVFRRPPPPPPPPGCLRYPLTLLADGQGALIYAAGANVERGGTLGAGHAGRLLAPSPVRATGARLARVVQRELLAVRTFRLALLQDGAGELGHSQTYTPVGRRGGGELGAHSDLHSCRVAAGS